MSNESANDEERQYRYLVDCGRYVTMSEAFHRKGPNNHNLHMPGNNNKYGHIIWCSDCGKYEPVIDVQLLPTRQEAEAFLNRNKRLRNNQMDAAATYDSR
jgi:predicted metal-binding transcription factor (methanogenesis marker protein 9)